MKNPIAPVTNFVRRNERRILVITTIASTSAALLMRTSVAQHNAFLKEHGLFDTFYSITEDA